MQQYKNKFHRLCGTILFVAIVISNGFLFSQDSSKFPAAKVKKEDESARVSILPLEDRTRSRDYEYMSESLSDALDKFMTKEFSYTRIDPREVEKGVYEVRQEILKGKIEKRDHPVSKNPSQKRKKTEEELQQDEAQLNLVKKLAKNLSSDIVIYGNYKYDNETSELLFTVNLYLTLSDTTRELNEMRSTVDYAIFLAAERVSKNLVGEIYTMIEEADKAAAEKKALESGENNKKKKTEVRHEENQPGDKVALTRKLAMSPTPDWVHKKIVVTLSPGFFINNLPSGGSSGDSNGGLCGTCEIQLAIAGRFWILPRIYLGAKVDFAEIVSRNISLGQMTVLDGLALLGYSIPLDRWLFSADLGGGYFLISSKVRGILYNPAFALRIGAEVLIADSFSIGLSANAHMYYDSLNKVPKPLTLGGLVLTFNHVM
jgi:hypothetical protein